MIKILSKNVADKIAAGEVVDRPLSIVKELVENSIDAEATSITIEIKNGGKSYIRVTDNGTGISSEEVSLAFMRHATSKISAAEDLNSIRTLGFRGEALASIAAVSRVELITKRSEDKMGTKMVMEGGEVVEVFSTGCPEGTTLVVSDLFYNTPARLKFMKHDSTETSLIVDFISRMALAYPSMQIRMISNGINLFTTPGRGNRQTNIQTIYSSDIGSGLIPISGNGEYFKLEGYVSKPSLTKTNRKHQIFFVNGRSINSKIMEKSLENAYFDKIFEGRFPVGFLFLTVDPGKVDVNIHPNKKEVRFDDDKTLMDFLTQVIRSHLNTNESISDITSDNISAVSLKKGLILEEQRENLQVQEQAQKQPDGEARIQTRETQVDIKQILSTIRENESASIEKDVPNNIEVSTINESAAVYKPFEMRDLTLIGTIFNTYILATLNDHLYLIDQHAAHERIFFEKLMKQYDDLDKTVQHLLIPFVVHVSLAVKESSLSWLEVLKNFGYEVEEFGVKAYKISGIPAFMSLREAEDFVLFFVENISEETNLQSREIIEKIMSRACKSAIKAGDHINMDEMAMLISQLSDCENPYSCPHGRPTFIKLTKHEIERMFKRV